MKIVTINPEKNPVGINEELSVAEYLHAHVKNSTPLYTSFGEMVIPVTQEEADMEKQFAQSLQGFDLAYRMPYKTKDSSLKASLFFQTLHGCFDFHRDFVLSPDAVWFMILNQVGICIKQNPKAYRSYFSDSLEKQQLEVRADDLSFTNDWQYAISCFKNEFARVLPKQTLDFLKVRFSTTSEIDSIAHLVAFMNITQEYYDFHVSSLCGIRQVKLLGGYDDWRKIVDCSNRMGKIFKELTQYFSTIVNVVESIQKIWEDSKPDLDFWKSMYTINQSSGGPTRVNGWISAFIAYTLQPQDTPQEQNSEYEYVLKDSFEIGGEGIPVSHLPSSIVQVPFTWQILGEPQKHMVLSAGFFGNSLSDDQFFKPELGFGVYQKV